MMEQQIDVESDEAYPYLWYIYDYLHLEYVRQYGIKYPAY